MTSIAQDIYPGSSIIGRGFDAEQVKNWNLF